MEVFIDNLKVAGPLKGGVGLMDLELDLAGWHNVRLVEMGGGGEVGGDGSGDILDDLSFSILVL